MKPDLNKELKKKDVKVGKRLGTKRKLRNLNRR